MADTVEGVTAALKSVACEPRWPATRMRRRSGYATGFADT